MFSEGVAKNRKKQTARGPSNAVVVPEKEAEGRLWFRQDKLGRCLKLMLLASILVLLMEIGNQALMRKPEKLQVFTIRQETLELKPEPVGVSTTSSAEGHDPESFSGMLKDRAIDNQIVLTVATELHMNMTLNMLCSWEKIGLTNYIVGALDAAVYDTLKVKGYAVFSAYKQSLLGGDELKTALNRRMDFRKANLVKEEVVLWAIDNGYEVVLSDTDIVWVHNPMRDLQENYREFDFLFQTKNNNDRDPYDLNGGFFYVKPTKESQAVMNMIVTRLSQDLKRNDQTEFQDILCGGPKRLSNTTCHDPTSGARTLMLPRYKYAKGRVLRDAEDAQSLLKKTDLFTLHYSGGLPGSKTRDMIMSEQWNLDEHQNCKK